MADLCLESMSVTVYCHIYDCLFMKMLSFFLLNDFIWNYRNLNNRITQTQLDILFEFSGFSRLINHCQKIESRNSKGSKICIFRSRPIAESLL